MNGSTTNDGAAVPAGESDPGIGARLREARVAADLSLADVSTRLHLDVKTVESLEADDYGSLPAPTFVRGYLRGYARLLGLPPAPIVAGFDRKGFGPPALVADISDQSETRSSDFPVRIATFFIIAVLVGLVFLWWQNRRVEEVDLTAATQPSVAAAQPVLPPEPGASTPAPTEGMKPRPGGEPEETTGGGAGERPAAAPENGGGAPAPSPAVANAGDGGTEAAGETGAGGPAENRDDVPPAAASPQAEPGPGPERTPAATPASEPVASAGPPPATGIADSPSSARIEMGFEYESWVEVYDRTGARLYYNLAKPGSKIALAGRPPIRVVLGYARGVTIEYNGRLIDYSPFISKGIARFELGGTQTAPAGNESASPPSAPSVSE